MILGVGGVGRDNSMEGWGEKITRWGQEVSRWLPEAIPSRSSLFMAQTEPHGPDSDNCLSLVVSFDNYGF